MALTAIQRARIRAVHNIEGSLIKDAVTVLYCQPCALMQQDRELRMRLGQDLDYGHGQLSKQTTLVTTAPVPSPPMTYIPPQPMSDTDIEPSLDSETMRQAMNDIPSSRSKKAADRKTAPYKEPKGKKEVPTIRIVDYSYEQMDTTNSPRQPFVSGVKSSPASAKDQCHNIRRVPVPHNVSSRAMRAEPGRQYQRAHDFSRIYDREGLSKSVNNLPQVASQRSSRKISRSEEQCRIDRRQIVSSRPTIAPTVESLDVINDCAWGSETRSSPPAKAHRVKASEPSLTESDFNVSKSSGGSSQRTFRDTREDSYVHDFTDCPIDKDILEHYEKEEQKAQQHTLAEGDPSFADHVTSALEVQLKQDAGTNSKDEDQKDSRRNLSTSSACTISTAQPTGKTFAVPELEQHEPSHDSSQGADAVEITEVDHAPDGCHSSNAQRNIDGGSRQVSGTTLTSYDSESVVDDTSISRHDQGYEQQADSQQTTRETANTAASNTEHFQPDVMGNIKDEDVRDECDASKVEENDDRESPRESAMTPRSYSSELFLHDYGIISESQQGHEKQDVSQQTNIEAVSTSDSNDACSLDDQRRVSYFIGQRVPSSRKTSDSSILVQLDIPNGQIQTFRRDSAPAARLSEASSVNIPATLSPRRGEHSAQHVLTQVLVTRTRTGRKQSLTVKDTSRTRSISARKEISKEAENLGGIEEKPGTPASI